MMFRKNVLLAVLTAAFVIIALMQIFRLSEENKKYEKLLNNSQRFASVKKQYSDDLERIEEIIGKERATPTEIIRRTMEFVHDNSVHVIDEEYRKYAFNKPFVMTKLLLAYQGHDSEKPHLSCGSRSHAMRAILFRFGIISRLVQVFSDDYQQLRGHRLLEVFNPDTESWEAWDPDFRVTYVDPVSKRRLDILAIVFRDRNKVVPEDGATTGWVETKTSHLRAHYFEAVSFEGINSRVPNIVIIINRNEFNLGKIFSNGLTLQEWMFKQYLHPRFIILPYAPARHNVANP